MSYGREERRSKVAPRRPWRAMGGLLMHSRQLHRLLVDDNTAPRAATHAHPTSVHAATATASIPTSTSMSSTAVGMHATTAMSAAPLPSSSARCNQPLAVRKTKRELQREREHRLRQHSKRLQGRDGLCHGDQRREQARELARQREREHCQRCHEQRQTHSSASTSCARKLAMLCAKRTVARVRVSCRSRLVRRRLSLRGLTLGMELELDLGIPRGPPRRRLLF